MKRRRRFTMEQRRAIVEKIEAMVKGGRDVKGAAVECGIADSMYRQWVKMLERGDKPSRGKASPSVRRSAPALLTLPVSDLPMSDRMVILMGPPAELRSALESLARIGG